MMNLHLGRWVQAHKALELFPTERFALATAVQMLEQYPCRFIAEHSDGFGVE